MLSEQFVEGQIVKKLSGTTPGASHRKMMMPFNCSYRNKSENLYLSCREAPIDQSFQSLSEDRLEINSFGPKKRQKRQQKPRTKTHFVVCSSRQGPTPANCPKAALSYNERAQKVLNDFFWLFLFILLPKPHFLGLKTSSSCSSLISLAAHAYGLADPITQECSCARRPDCFKGTTE